MLYFCSIHTNFRKLVWMEQISQSNLIRILNHYSSSTVKHLNTVLRDRPCYLHSIFFDEPRLRVLTSVREETLDHSSRHRPVQLPFENHPVVSQRTVTERVHLRPACQHLNVRLREDVLRLAEEAAAQADQSGPFVIKKAVCACLMYLE